MKQIMENAGKEQTRITPNMDTFYGVESPTLRIFTEK